MRARGSIRAWGRCLSALAALVAACAPTPKFIYGELPIRPAFNARVCEAVERLVRAPTGPHGVRSVRFMPFGANEDYIDFYAPMAGDPYDDHAIAFYDDGPGRLTHYVGAPELGAVFAQCLSVADGFGVVVEAASEDCFYAVSTDHRAGRTATILSTVETTAIIIGADGAVDTYFAAVSQLPFEECRS